MNELLYIKDESVKDDSHSQTLVRLVVLYL